jgi:hypothetical protein
MGAQHVEPQLHAAASSGVAASIAGCCAHSERGLTGQHGRQRGRPRSDQSGFVIFDARSLTSVRTRRRPLASPALFQLQTDSIVCDRTLPIRPWNPFTLLRALSRCSICVRRPSTRPLRECLLHERARTAFFGCCSRGEAAATTVREPMSKSICRACAAAAAASFGRQSLLRSRASMLCAHCCAPARHRSAATATASPASQRASSAPSPSRPPPAPPPTPTPTPTPTSRRGYLPATPAVAPSQPTAAPPDAAPPRRRRR